MGLGLWLAGDGNSMGKTMELIDTKKKKDIFTQFLYHHHLSFSEIEKKTGLRSNDVAYHLQQFVRSGILSKKGNKYSLTKEYERFVSLFSDYTSPLLVILIACRNEGKVLLLKREKRPYKDCWGLIGGRIRTGEAIAEASTRILKEKTFLEGTFKQVNAVLLEHVKDSDENGVERDVKHSYILILVTMTPTTGIKEKEHLKWFSTKKLPSTDIIPSDKWLIQHKLNETITIHEEEVAGEGEEGAMLSMKMKK